MRRTVQCVIAGLLCEGMSVAVVGCATQTRTVKTEQTVRYPTATTERAPEQQVVIEKESTTEVRHEPHGVLSTVVHLLGEVLALPFRLVGGLLRLLF